jgi:hypothetical protein
LPIYDRHDCSLEAVLVDDKSQVEELVKQARLGSMAAIVAVRDSKEKAVDMYEVGKAHTQTALAYLTDEANILPRAAVITAGGLTGLLIGARGGFFKKLTYTSIGMISMASLCYPRQAVVVSQDLYKIGKYYTILAYANIKEQVDNLGSSSPSSKPAPAPKTPPSVEKVGEQKAEKKPVVGDIGQSNPADKDMYTTRK